MGLSGVGRGRSWVRTAVTDAGADRPADLVDRAFWVQAPHRLWLADLERHEAVSNREEVRLYPPM